MIPSSSGEQEATYISFDTYTNIPNYILMYLFEQKRGDLGRTALKVYLYLRSMKNNNSGLAWPGVRRIVNEAHVNRNDVKPARDQLVAVGLISILPIKGPRGTVLIDFNDEQIMKTMSQRYSIGITASVTPLGEHSVTPLGEHTNTNTITTLPNTNRVGKRKKKKKSSSPTPTNQIPDAKQIQKGVLPQWNNTTHVRQLSSDQIKQRQAAWESKQKAPN